MACRPRSFMYLLKKDMHRTFRKLLYYYFRFDKWHVSTLYERKYAKDIICYLNSQKLLNHGSALEIGCGLGDIIRNLKFRERLGLDHDIRALKVGQFLSIMRLDFRVDFRQFSFPDDQLLGRFDVIIMVNWIHHISPDVLKNNLVRYFTSHLNNKGELLIDTVQSDKYRYNHSIDYLTKELYCSILKLGEYENNRSVFAIRNYC